MAGAILQLAAYGAQDICLTGNPEITFFKMIYRRHTNFSIETLRENFQGSSGFGQRISIILPRKGDLVSNLFLRIELPALPQDIKRSWTNSIGHVIIKDVEIEIGGQQINKITGEWLEIYAELTETEERRKGFYEMIGKIPSGISTINSKSHQGKMLLYVPLRFWFCKHIGSALPLIALQHHEVRLHINLRKFEECYISSDQNDRILNMFQPCVSLLVDYIYLDTLERYKFAQHPHSYLIEQLQYKESNSLPRRAAAANISLEFNHPIKEIVWIVQRSDVGERNVSDEIYGNDWFNFSLALGDPEEVIDTFFQAKLVINNEDRIQKFNAKYFRLVQNYERHTRVPNNYIYTYSFALLPEEHQPTGQANFSRFDSVFLLLTFKNEHFVSDYRNIRAYAVNYNVLKILSGQAGLQYSN